MAKGSWTFGASTANLRQKRFSQRILPNVNKRVATYSRFPAFRNQYSIDLVHQREHPILVADENITYEIQERHCQLTCVLALCLITS
jgi:hypothetical protein